MHALRHSRGNASLLIALAVALWLASTLGLMHRVLHPGASNAPASVAVAQAHGMGHVHKVEQGGLLALFGEHVDADCRLYDQLAGGAAALSVPLVVLPIALPMARFHYFLGEALVRWVTFFDARGPPVNR
ncbi:hypothetical protein [Variovorax sp. LT1R16]|uniref:hypothetical protein n=1 Tax=Variovorax sp. LT1R16 TaxID=3443728 RepID=UPI003F4458E2